MVHNMLTRKAGNKSQHHYFVFQHLSAHLWILLKLHINFFFFYYSSAGIAVKFMSTPSPSCSHKWQEKEMGICLVCFTLKYSGLQCSGWASWLSGRTHTIKIGKLSRRPELEFLFFFLVMCPAGQGTADRAVTLLYISLFRAGFCVWGSACSYFSCLILLFWG